MKYLFLTVALVAGLFVAHHLAANDTVNPAEGARRVAAGQAVLVDVREPAEWADTGVAAPAALLPLSDLQGDRTQWRAFLEKNRGKELILYCRTGRRSGIAAKILAQEGWTTANAGGFKDWTSAGLPVRKLGHQGR